MISFPNCQPGKKIANLWVKTEQSRVAICGQLTSNGRDGMKGWKNFMFGYRSEKGSKAHKSAEILEESVESMDGVNELEDTSDVKTKSNKKGKRGRLLKLKSREKYQLV